MTSWKTIRQSLAALTGAQLGAPPVLSFLGPRIRLLPRGRREYLRQHLGKIHLLISQCDHSDCGTRRCHRTAVATGNGELHLFLVPVLLGGGKRGLSQTAREELELLDEHCFRSGFTHLHYCIVDKPLREARDTISQS